MTGTYWKHDAGEQAAPPPPEKLSGSAVFVIGLSSLADDGPRRSSPPSSCARSLGSGREQANEIAARLLDRRS